MTMQIENRIWAAGDRLALDDGVRERSTGTVTKVEEHRGYQNIRIDWDDETHVNGWWIAEDEKLTKL